MKCGGNARRATTPVVASHRKSRQPERVREVDQVLAYRGLFRHPRGGRFTKTCGAVPAEVRNDYPVPLVGKRRRHLVPGPDVVRKAVQQDDGEALDVTALLKANIQHKRLDGTRAW